MNEQIKAKNSEEIKKLQARLDEIEKTLRVVLEGIKSIELNDIEENRLADGTYLGVEFDADRCDW